MLYKYISLKILSLLGYLGFIFSLYFLFQENFFSVGFSLPYLTISNFALYYTIYSIVCSLIFLLFILEIVIKKNIDFKNEKPNVKTMLKFIYSFFFYFGLITALLLITGNIYLWVIIGF